MSGFGISDMFDVVALQAESSVQQLQGVLTQREGKITALEEELKHLREHKEQQKSTVRFNRSGFFFSSPLSIKFFLLHKTSDFELACV